MEARTGSRSTSPRRLDHDPAKLRRLRYQAALSQKALAKRVEITTGHMSALETGGRNLSPELLARLAEALGCARVDLLADVPRKTGVR